VIQSKGNAFTTTYIHLNEALEVGACGNTNSLRDVSAGDPIGTTKYLSTGAHLHFGLRVKPYISADEQTAWAGALLPSKMPEAFVNPQLIDWQ